MPFKFITCASVWLLPNNDAGNGYGNGNDDYDDDNVNDERWIYSIFQCNSETRTQYNRLLCEWIYKICAPIGRCFCFCCCCSNIDIFQTNEMNVCKSNGRNCKLFLHGHFNDVHFHVFWVNFETEYIKTDTRTFNCNWKCSIIWPG